jgi:actin-related protein
MDLRKTLVESVCIVGGTSMIHGFKEAFDRELRLALSKDKMLSHLHEHLKLLDLPFKGNLLAWTGGSVFGTLKGVSSVSEIHRSDWLSQKQEQQQDLS